MARWIPTRVALAVALSIGTSGLVFTQEDGAAPETEKKTTAIRLKDGSVVRGEVVEMTDGTLKLKTTFAGEVPIEWEEIKQLASDLKLRFVLQQDGDFSGTVRTKDDELSVTVDGLDDPVEFPLSAVAAINPPPVKAVTYTGNINFGGSIQDGNTQTKAASSNAEFVMRSKLQRLTARGAWNYAEDDDGLIARNTKGSLKYDFFVTERFYLFAGALFEGDKFQNLNLRTALSAGAGYQFLNKGDLEGVGAGLEGYVETGIAYVSEDFRRNADDEQYLSGRWALKLDWELNPRVSLFHFHEGYPSFENSDDLYITTEQGIRLKIWENFLATFQVNWRWDNTPSPGFERSDTLYLATLGYAFEI